MPQKGEVRYVEKRMLNFRFPSSRRGYIDTNGVIDIGLIPLFSKYLQQEEYRTTDCRWHPTKWKFQNVDQAHAHVIYLMNGKGYGGPIPRVAYR